jgi:hypothetical protein
MEGQSFSTLSITILFNLSYLIVEDCVQIQRSIVESTSEYQIRVESKLIYIQI